ncbi:SpvB/TcaC N-terminal domain-containing protein [Chromobacterium violaceum]|uniref:Mono(ADP-ribosyl)transferase SpvB n=1 Tax=Chromobacterium violaceum TaxID=536 RepID=A0AAX2M8L4_CHRVL|nr:SpvB/TcaC N-terminal domain-containing protein [Chromobacterium violaceum]OLZ86022.1 hypothetical protein BS642_02425 [Chromobacterium violaceum]STB63882.1 Mono(ADP-ribosyl)transferase SpvB [Chromobacterium violaceum]SUX32629.1 Mono(ADP-ribosyl)transferase SpvB [Chromobacterium violaceum]
MKDSAQNSATVVSLSLPKGGGAIQGMGQGLVPGGYTGVAEMLLPLPISEGRGYAPALALSYSSGGGNGPFGIGWQLPIMMVRRATHKGTPRYDASDIFHGPDGELLVPERDEQGALVQPTVCNLYNGVSLGKSYSVTRYFPRVESAFNRLERWQEQGVNDDPGFWLLHGADGQLHCFGKGPSARLADREHPLHVAEWWLEESLSPTGQQIRYEYRVEAASDVDTSNTNSHAHRYACEGYLSRVYYGNKRAAASLSAWAASAAISADDWHFILVFDYGERGTDPTAVPAYASTVASMPIRKDPFSRYEYGFESRMYRLCHQVLMFHQFTELNNQHPILVKRLLLEYDDNPYVSRLIGARSLAYESNGTMVALPPLDLRYTQFSPSWASQQWRPFEAMSDLNDAQRYQLVDLYGEGIPGVLSRTGTAWRYRDPIRGQADSEAVAYDGWHLLPSTPAMQSAQMTLMDITGNGKLDWVIGQPGLAGYFTMNPDKTWSTFVPFAAWPLEFQHPQAQLADLVGAGLPDLAMIGPKSVRLYANRRNGFAAPLDVEQSADVALPIAGRDATELVAFADMLGSGQQHLVSVRHDAVMCWPNLGRGHFGEPLRLTGLKLDSVAFNPEQVFLADLDGSGATDVIYAESDRLLIFLNRAGNDFVGPIVLPMPEDVSYDRLCQLSFADLYGLGVASIVLTCPHMSSRHWHYDLVASKPYLLDGCNNNMGADTQITYRSSAQEWLDEKRETPGAVCHLPFPVQVLSKVVTRDEITKNYLVQYYKYRKGAYDGKEREFRGFGLVETQDADVNASTESDHDSYSAPVLTRTWFYTGLPEDDAPLPDLNAVSPSIQLGSIRFTRFASTSQQDVLLTSAQIDGNRNGLYRALKGGVRRQAVYGLDQSDSRDIPYGVTTSRYQVRLLQEASPGSDAVVLPLPLEQLSYQYERVSTDPVISQSVQVQFDKFGVATQSVGIYYPRLAKQANSPYPASLPDSAYASSYDEQQQVLRLQEQRVQVRHLTEPQAWRLSLPDMQRQNVLHYASSEVPSGGLSFEELAKTTGLLGNEKNRIFAGQNKVVYADNSPAFIALVDHVESAELDDACLVAYDPVLSGDARTKKLTDAGYVHANKILPVTPSVTESQVWVVRAGYATYFDASGFYLPKTQQKTSLTGELKIRYDAYYCCVMETVDVLENTAKAEYDYRFLQPWRLTDINGNIQEVRFDALGRVVASSFYGKEKNVAVGFDPVKDFVLPGNVSEAISHPITPQTVATYGLTDVYSWMGKLPQAMLQPDDEDKLLAIRFITPEGYLRSIAHQWAESGEPVDTVRSSSLRSSIGAVERIPVHGATFTADRYPKDVSSQQIRITVEFSDGFGRALQSAIKHEAGMAFQRTDTGKLKVTSSSTPVEASATARWAVSGRVEYDNKGQTVRIYPPFFVNDWRYIVDDSMRAVGYADLHYYDPLGREIEVKTAKGYLRRWGYFPWFTVFEDENDTLSN